MSFQMRGRGRGFPRRGGNRGFFYGRGGFMNDGLKSDPRGMGKPYFRDGPNRGFRSRFDFKNFRGGRGRMRFKDDRRPFLDERRLEERLYREEGRHRGYLEKERHKSSYNSGFQHRSEHRYGGSPKRRSSPPYSSAPSKKMRMDSESPPRKSREHSHDWENEEEEDFHLEELETGGEQDEHLEKIHSSDDSNPQMGDRSGDEAPPLDEEMKPRRNSRVFVELKCPHCPGQYSVTFKEYKYHLTSDGHRINMHRLARKHSVMLRKIRLQQRNELRDEEEAWKEKDEQGFEDTESRFCSTCKLAYKCSKSNIREGRLQHTLSKLHKMQRHYLHPGCSICRQTFPSRMVYEHHVASIPHLRVKASEADSRKAKSDSDSEESPDLSGFMTLDSVGEDEVGSEHEDITGGLDSLEEVAAEGSVDDPGILADDSEELLELETPFIQERIKNSRPGGVHSRLGIRSSKRGSSSGDIPHEVDYEEVKEEDVPQKPLGANYVSEIKAYFCKLCYKVLPADSAPGQKVIDMHCASLTHLTHYHEKHPLVGTAELKEKADDTQDTAGKQTGSSTAESQNSKGSLVEEGVHDEDEDDEDFQANLCHLDDLYAEAVEREEEEKNGFSKDYEDRELSPVSHDMGEEGDSEGGAGGDSNQGVGSSPQKNVVVRRRSTRHARRDEVLSEETSNDAPQSAPVEAAAE